MQSVGDNGNRFSAQRLADASETSSAEQAYSRIKSLIITLKLSPGSTIHEADLLRQFGVGRTPLREALLHLQRDGMLRIYPRRAIIVTKLGLQEIRQIFEMRMILERSAASLAAQRITDVEIQELLFIGVKLRESHSRIEPFDFLKADQVFHRAIAYYAQNAYLLESLDRILTLNFWLWNMYFAERGAYGGDFLAHKPIIDALVTHDMPAAEAAMGEHISRSKQLLLNGLK